MIKSLTKFFLITIAIKAYFTQLDQKQIISENHFRSLNPTPMFNSSSQLATELKLHSKILQTVYSESFSKNYYYTTLYIGQNRVKQTYIIDTGISIMSSPCSPCEECAKHKRNYYLIFNKKYKPLKCENKICKILPATNCKYKKDKDLNKKSCSFDIERSVGDGIKGYYLNDIVYFEVDRNLKLPFQRQQYRSYALPIGCTTGEYGKYKELNPDGIMGVNNNEKSFIGLLYKLKIINRNLFSLCFGLRGGYMSLGEIDTSYHKNESIDYVPLLTSDISYLIQVKGISVGDNNNTIYSKSDAIIDTGNTISYFPNYIYKSLIKQFKKACENESGKCGDFKFEQEYGYCSSFEDRESLFKAIYEYWPNITLHLNKKKKYIWKPINYYYYYLKDDQRKACLGFNSHKSQNIILGTNFIHGHDIIFDRGNQKLGFVPADCSRGNLLLKRFRGFHRHNLPLFDNNPALIDKEVHKSEKEGEFKLGDNYTNDMLEFIQGHNTELDFNNDFQTINFIILLSSLIIVVVVVGVVISALICNKRGQLKYELHEETYEENYNEEDNNENKISFEDSK